MADSVPGTVRIDARTRDNAGAYKVIEIRPSQHRPLGVTIDGSALHHINRVELLVDLGAELDPGQSVEAEPPADGG